MGNTLMTVACAIGGGLFYNMGRSRSRSRSVSTEPVRFSQYWLTLPTEVRHAMTTNADLSETLEAFRVALNQLEKLSDNEENFSEPSAPSSPDPNLCGSCGHAWN